MLGDVGLQSSRPRQHLRYLVRRTISTLGIEEVLSAPRSPWQNPFAERAIGSIRRELLDQVIVPGETHVGKPWRVVLSSKTDLDGLELPKEAKGAKTLRPKRTI